MVYLPSQRIIMSIRERKITTSLSQKKKNNCRSKEAGGQFNQSINRNTQFKPPSHPRHHTRRRRLPAPNHLHDLRPRRLHLHRRGHAPVDGFVKVLDGLVVAAEGGGGAGDDDADVVGEMAVEDAWVDAAVEDLFDLGGCWVRGWHFFGEDE